MPVAASPTEMEVESSVGRMSIVPVPETDAAPPSNSTWSARKTTLLALALNPANVVISPASLCTVAAVVTFTACVNVMPVLPETPAPRLTPAVPVLPKVIAPAVLVSCAATVVSAPVELRTMSAAPVIVAAALTASAPLSVVRLMPPPVVESRPPAVISPRPLLTVIVPVPVEIAPRVIVQAWTPDVEPSTWILPDVESMLTPLRSITPAAVALLTWSVKLVAPRLRPPVNVPLVLIDSVAWSVIEAAELATRSSISLSNTVVGPVSANVMKPSPPLGSPKNVEVPSAAPSPVPPVRVMIAGSSRSWPGTAGPPSSAVPLNRRFCLPETSAKPPAPDAPDPVALIWPAKLV
ncbi:MAG: hypothetical protein GIKADHBN_03238 [Phycisphaerales bacterium]|nr:hypothetical protein [Phycisphaerales bacterium]